MLPPDPLEVFPLVVMGVSGSGKSTIGALLASRLGWSFLEGDDFHPSSNLEKMSRGIALSDADRHPWLEALGQTMSTLWGTGRPCVVACSALRRSYRQQLCSWVAQARFIHLDIDPTTLAGRLGTRTGHFADARLSASQLATLEPPAQSEALVVDASRGPSEIVAEIRTRFGI